MFRRSLSVSDVRLPQQDVIKTLLSEDKKSKFKRSATVSDGNEFSRNCENFSKPSGSNYYPETDTSVWMRSCEKEVIEPILGKISGNIPIWLEGTLLRNGPGSLKVGNYEFNHLFDSSALLHRFDIRKGKVTYQNRFVQTEVFKKNRAANRIVLTEFGTKAVPDPCQTIFSRVAAVLNPIGMLSDNSMISVYPFGDEYYTFSESPYIHRIDPETLDTLNRVNISKYINIVSHSSHPHVMNDGTVFNLGLSITKSGPAYTVVRFSSSEESEENNAKKRKLSMFEQAKIVASLPSRWVLNPSYMHTFGITENYFVIVEQPLAIGLLSTVGCLVKNEPTIGSLKWHESEKTHICLISRKTGKLEKRFITEAFFYLHIINQYETTDGNYLILDICCYQNAKMIDCMYVETMKNIHSNPDYSKLFRGRPLRFVLPLMSPEAIISTEINLVQDCTPHQSSTPCSQNSHCSKNEDSSSTFENSPHSNQNQAAAYRLADGNIFVVPELLCDLGCETPRINYENNMGKEYRYFYAISSDVDSENPGTIIKVDTVLGTKMLWYEENVYPSEPIFVPHPKAKKEDDGIILSALVWGKDQEREVGLLIVNASDFTEIARVYFKTPSPVPKCLHGWFILRN